MVAYQWIKFLKQQKEHAITLKYRIILKTSKISDITYIYSNTIYRKEATVLMDLLYTLKNSPSYSTDLEQWSRGSLPDTAGWTRRYLRAAAPASTWQGRWPCRIWRIARSAKIVVLGCTRVVVALEAVLVAH